jgi:myo-inositol-1(or 4)-monophosphatase
MVFQSARKLREICAKFALNLCNLWFQKPLKIWEPSSMSPRLEVARAAAQAAARALRHKVGQTRVVQSKGWRNIVTDADFAAEHAALAVIRAHYPDHAILSEEDKEARVDLRAPGPLWIVDPLDGTTNYAHHLPVFSVSLALAEAGELQVGVIVDPLRDQVFYAEKGRGAWAQTGRRTPQPMRVSATATLDDAVVALDWARDPALRERTLQSLHRAATVCRTARAFGSAALGLAYLAAGWVDGYFHYSAQPWDLAAGVLLLTEAGGHITTPTNDAWSLGHPQLIASNSIIHAPLLQTLVKTVSPQMAQIENLANLR